MKKILFILGFVSLLVAGYVCFPRLKEIVSPFSNINHQGE